MWSVDLFRCESIVLRSYWVLVVTDQFTRRLVGIGVHRGAITGADLCCMFNAAIHRQGAPRHLSTDHDPLVEAHRCTANLRSGDRCNQNRAECADVTPIRGPLNWDDAARIPRSGAVPECR